MTSQLLNEPSLEGSGHLFPIMTEFYVKQNDSYLKCRVIDSTTQSLPNGTLQKFCVIMDETGRIMFTPIIPLSAEDIAVMGGTSSHGPSIPASGERNVLSDQDVDLPLQPTEMETAPPGDPTDNRTASEPMADTEMVVANDLNNLEASSSEIESLIRINEELVNNDAIGSTTLQLFEPEGGNQSHSSDDDDDDDEESEEGDYQCSSCVKTFPTKIDLIKHGTAKHRLLLCRFPDCNAELRGEAQWRKHNRQKHDAADGVKCYLCDCLVPMKEINEHIVNGHGPIRYMCKKCRIGFTNQDFLANHEPVCCSFMKD